MNILVIRRDNIGDLLCTTPLLHGLRHQLKPERLDLLTNSYVAPVMIDNPDLDQVLVYQKAKHAPRSFWRIAHEKWSLIRALRCTHYDLVLAFDRRAQRLANVLRKTRVLTPLRHWDRGTEVERAWELGTRIGLTGSPGPLVLPKNMQHLVSRDPQLIGLHISARRPKQRYPVSQWAELIAMIGKTDPALRFRILWSPGKTDHPQHPGDDELAETLRARLRDLPVEFYPSHTLELLVSAIQKCGSIILADGGAMHIAAACQIPLVALFGDSDARRWAPWECHHILLQPDTHEVKDLSPTEILDAWKKLNP